MTGELDGDPVPVLDLVPQGPRLQPLGHAGRDPADDRLQVVGLRGGDGPRVSATAQLDRAMSQLPIRLTS